MSSNDIDYYDDGFKTIDGVEVSDDESITFDDGETLMFKMNDIEQPKKDLNDMDKYELLEIIKKDKENKKRYIKKYQQTEKGRNKTREASKKYYDANRAKILERKRLSYLKRKENNIVKPIMNN
mgnify:CR=1 FL=1